MLAEVEGEAAAVLGCDADEVDGEADPDVADDPEVEDDAADAFGPW